MYFLIDLLIFKNVLHSLVHENLLKAILFLKLFLPKDVLLYNNEIQQQYSCMIYCNYLSFI
jgi:hypothetical protein